MFPKTLLIDSCLDLILVYNFFILIYNYSYHNFHGVPSATLMKNKENALRGTGTRISYQYLLEA